ncbi:hypothetical protein A5N82_13985 [Christensenella minuta]|uniref:DNA-binding helix-turn-helix protein n=2 Tax=Christensenellaceae TaxID=990719 RepID=A0A136Q7G6_9FIRM|nr:DNA-binding helix-turn-helix protein [Christensenella minuta]OAQ37609.1 hypothetical protein A5N82_13985 [Christensenella minuta]
MKINSTMNDMAKKLDISESYYSLIENGDRQTDMSLSIIEKLAKAFGVSVQTIVKEEMKYKKENQIA